LIVPLHAGNPSFMTGAGNWTYLLTGRHPVLIDAGTGEASHLAAIHAARADGPGHVIVTHAHGDHISGARGIHERWPSATFAKFPWPDRDSRYDVPWSALADGDTIPAGDDELQVIHTPGHAPDHIALWQASTRTLFAGDLIVQGTTVVIPASAGGSLSAYLQSLARVLSLAPARVLPAHGPPIDDPEKVIRQYIAHREERDQQVRAAVSSGMRRVDQIVEHIYVRLPQALVPMACESVLAHLLKLEDEGAVRRDGDEWYAPKPDASH
jgi:glyoxylase-like metal-dependent hydrolase (beta-lactamase superfamily II)